MPGLISLELYDMTGRELMLSSWWSEEYVVEGKLVDADLGGVVCVFVWY